MSSAAAAETASAAAAAPDTSAGVAARAHCENCGAPVTDRYCACCGQRLASPVHSLWHFAKIATEDLTHADSRLWRTLAALLLRPGFLTREFLTGRRARYLPPVRLYLVLSVVLLLYLSATHSALPVLQLRLPQHGAPSASVGTLGDDQSSAFGTAIPGESAEQRAARLCGGVNFEGPWRQRLRAAAHRACRQMVIDNGRGLRAAVLHNLPRAMFIFLPVLAGIMMLMYWRPPHYYVEHLLLFVHNHACVFLVLVLVGLLSALLPFLSPWLEFAVALYIPWYVYRSMRVLYGQGRWLTLGKLGLLSFFYLASAVLMLTVTSLYSALTL